MIWKAPKNSTSRFYQFPTRWLNFIEINLLDSVVCLFIIVDTFTPKLTSQETFDRILSLKIRRLNSLLITSCQSLWFYSFSSKEWEIVFQVWNIWSQELLYTFSTELCTFYSTASSILEDSHPFVNILPQNTSWWKMVHHAHGIPWLSGWNIQRTWREKSATQGFSFCCFDRWNISWHQHTWEGSSDRSWKTQARNS